MTNSEAKPQARIKATEVKALRQSMWLKQKGQCALCMLPLDPKDANLDHCHTSGHVRGVIHRGCNLMLGKVENNYKRFGIKDLKAVINNLIEYIHCYDDHPSGIIHFTHRTAEERKQLAKKRAARRKKNGTG